MLFESHGFPCSHMFCAMKHEHIDSILESLLCKQWSKEAKKDYIHSICEYVSDSKRALALRVGAFSALSYPLMMLAAKNVDNFTWATEQVLRLYTNLHNRSNYGRNPITDEKGVGDPNLVKTKGAPSSKRFGKKKKRKCSYCHKTGHYISRCLNLNGVQHDGRVDDYNSLPILS